MKAVDFSIPYHDPIEYLALLPHDQDVLCLDGANYPQQDASLNRYSYLLWDPVKTVFLGEKVGLDPFAELQVSLAGFNQCVRSDLPPFQGGAAGFLAYELGTHFESVPRHVHSVVETPDYAMAIYDVVLAFDHLEKKAWIVSSGFPAKTSDAIMDRAKIRLKEREDWLLNAVKKAPFSSVQLDWTALKSMDEYCDSIRKAKKYIESGDVFEVNVSQVFQAKLPSGVDALSVYQALRVSNPAPFSSFYRCGEFYIASASPEQFLSVESGQVTARPIKGTIARDEDPLIDKENKNMLKNSIKDRAENIMIVDLMRSDLSRVCEHDSVKVEALCALEQYASLYHLVSVITARLAQDQDVFDLLRATFPGGSITGAPKIRSMEIIHELESCARGAYCGSLGYITFNQDVNFSILIRSLIGCGQEVMLQAGGAIVLDSDPIAEYEETLLKAARCQLSETL